MMIGVFDSGLGGELVASRLKNLLPKFDFQVVNDRAHLPYGDKSAAEILRLTDLAIQPLIKACPVIVLACNTATAAAIDELRTKYPKTKFVGFEPMVKPAAALSKTGRAVILATTATRRSTRYRSLIANYASTIRIIEPDTTGWAASVEAGQADTIDLGETAAAALNGADVVALACTHYLALEKRLKTLLPKVKVIEPTAAVARQISRLTS